MNYRKFYEEKTGTTVSKDEEIHHLDYDRSNNAITNLVKIPRKLHKQYHSYLRIAEHYYKTFENASEEIKKEYSFEIKKAQSHILKFKEKENEIKKYIEFRNNQLEVI